MRPAARHRPCRAAAGAAILVIAAPVLSACSGAADRTEPTAAAAAIEIRTFIFSPDPLEVPPGTEVTFTNADATTHTVTAGTRAAPTGEFDASLDGAESFTRVFDEPGTYEYFCDLHPGDGMTGTIVVG